MRKVRNLDVATTASELRDATLVLVAELEKGQIKPEIAKQIFNGIGKAAKLAALQIEFATVNKTKAKCAFVENAE